ncbi:ATP-binding cassette domain-containing protein [Alicyclobacillus fodiniaquatilis]|uniref:ATP-binding cassette domain-containing protein n=1 Tax=Alicyclobacillus fodiniaquatilis TaxID=1661150 RepID=A0ABW4JBI3_9BACL
MVKNFLSGFARSISALWASNFVVLVAQILVSVLSGLIPGAYVWATAQLVTSLSEHQSPLLYMSVLIISLLLQNVLNPVSQWLSTIMSRHANVYMTERVMAGTRMMSLVDMDNPEKLDETNLWWMQTAVSPFIIATNIPEAVQGTLSLVAVLSAVASVAGIWSALVVTALAAASFIELVYMNKNMELVVSYTSERRRLDYLRGIILGRDAAKEIRAYPRFYEYIRDLFMNYAKRYNQREIHLASKRMLALTLSGLALFLTQITVILWLVHAVTHGVMKIGSIAALIQGLITITAVSGTVFTSFREITQASLFLNRLPNRFTDTLDGTVENKAASGTPETLNIRNLSFSYPASNELALDNVSLEIPFGQHVALVGENGSGKSTLIKILSGLIQPQQGTVTLQGQPIVPPESRIHVVFQDFWKPALSVRDAVRMSTLHRSVDDTELESAIEKANAQVIMKKHSANLDTYLTRQFDDSGMELSGGEWQRLCLSRAFVDHRTAVILLDEPTSAISPLEELEIYESLSREFRGRTMVLVSHRLGVAKYVDRIVVLKHGRIVQDGPHHQLINEGGTYAEMFNRVAELYSTSQESIS